MNVFYVRTVVPMTGGRRRAIHTVYINGVSTYTYRTQKGLWRKVGELTAKGYVQVPDPWDRRRPE